MDKKTENGDHPTSQSDAGVQRRGLLRFGTLLTAFTGASAISAIGASSAEAGPGEKTPSTAYVPMSEKGAPLGVATLDVGSKVPPSMLPDLSTTYVPVIGNVEMADRKKFTGRVLMNTMESNAYDYTGPVALSAGTNTFRASAAVNFTGAGSNGIRGDSIDSDEANITGTSFGTCNFVAVEGAGGFAGRGSIHGFQFRGIIAPHPQGDVYGEMGGFISTVTSNRKGALAEGAEIQVRSNAGSPSRMAAVVAIAMEHNDTIPYWSRGVWSVSGGSQRAGEAFHASGAGWTYGFRYQNSADQDLFKVDQTGAMFIGVEQRKVFSDANGVNFDSNLCVAHLATGQAEIRAINSNGITNELRFYNDSGTPGLVFTNSIRASGNSMQLRAGQTTGHAKGAEVFNNLIELRAGRRLGFFAATPIVQPTRAGQIKDSSGGMATSTVGAITDVRTRDAIATIVAKLNTIEAQLSAAAGGFGLTT